MGDSPNEPQWKPSVAEHVALTAERNILAKALTDLVLAWKVGTSLQGFCEKMHETETLLCKLYPGPVKQAKDRLKQRKEN